MNHCMLTFIPVNNTFCNLHSTIKIHQYFLPVYLHMNNEQIFCKHTVRAVWTKSNKIRQMLPAWFFLQINYSHTWTLIRFSSCWSCSLNWQVFPANSVVNKQITVSIRIAKFGTKYLPQKYTKKSCIFDILTCITHRYISVRFDSNISNKVNYHFM